MLFHTFEFWAFFAATIAIFYTVPFRVGKIALLFASYFFYMQWDARFAALILASTVLDFLLGIGLSRGSPEKKKLLLVVSVVANLGILGFFKYYNFFAASLAALLGVSEQMVVLQIVLPVGISFYTFKSMSYTIDVYRGWLKPVTSFPDYALFVAFFPELVAGPIVRADVFFPQLFNWRRPTAADVEVALRLILSGLVRKVVFADHFAPISDLYFKNPAAQPGAVAAWTGAVAFSMQIYFDFSGYTDIARGCALLLGIKFPVNFKRPYMAVNIAEFWKRWHMSLSQWLRDYLYISLGGNRKGSLITYRNLMGTMLLGGLWHGASWTFVVWGGLHGALLVGHRLTNEVTGATVFGRIMSHEFLAPLKVGATMFFVLIGWVFFRAASLEDAMVVIRAMFSLDWAPTTVVFSAVPVLLIGTAFVLEILEERTGLIERLWATRAWFRIATSVVLLFLLTLLPVTDQTIPFIYFQF